MTIVDCVHAESELPETTRLFGHDTVTLGWEARTRAHALRRTDGGVAFGLSLPRGTVLRDGDRFVLDQERLVVVVVEQLEPVFLVTPPAATDWALFAYHIGNRHQPLMIAGDALVCPEVEGMEQLLQRHRMPYTRAMRAFTPATAALAHSH